LLTDLKGDEIPVENLMAFHTHLVNFKASEEKYGEPMEEKH